MDAKIKAYAFGINDIFDVWWQLCKQNFRQILPVILCVYIPINIILAFVPDEVLLEDYELRVRLHQLVSQVLDLFIGSIATIAVAHIIETAIKGQEPSWIESLQHGVSRWASAVGTDLLAGLIIMGLSLLLVIPGIIWSCYYIFQIYVVGLRNLGGKAALDYSKKLVKGQWWRVFGIELVIGIAPLSIIFPIGVLYVLLPDHLLVRFICYLLLDIATALFAIMAITFFLNTDYLRNPLPAEANVPPNYLRETHDRTTETQI